MSSMNIVLREVYVPYSIVWNESPVAGVRCQAVGAETRRRSRSTYHDVMTHEYVMCITIFDIRFSVIQTLDVLR